mmetsp:Transcript_138545/g.430865  ORF Transcript_138545/g.430865 Transcript_138545/m.430865 type:complete len:335 (+) Transcript_138545:430-1434(+)
MATSASSVREKLPGKVPSRPMYGSTPSRRMKLQSLRRKFERWPAKTPTSTTRSCSQAPRRWWSSLSSPTRISQRMPSRSSKVYSGAAGPSGACAWASCTPKRNHSSAGPHAVCTTRPAKSESCNQSQCVSRQMELDIQCFSLSTTRVATSHDGGSASSPSPTRSPLAKGERTSSRRATSLLVTSRSAGVFTKRSSVACHALTCAAAAARPRSSHRSAFWTRQTRSSTSPWAKISWARSPSALQPHSVALSMAAPQCSRDSARPPEAFRRSRPCSAVATARTSSTQGCSCPACTSGRRAVHHDEGSPCAACEAAQALPSAASSTRLAACGPRAMA